MTENNRTAAAIYYEPPHVHFIPFIPGAPKIYLRAIAPQLWHNFLNFGLKFLPHNLTSIFFQITKKKIFLIF